MARKRWTRVGLGAGILAVIVVVVVAVSSGSDDGGGDNASQGSASQPAAKQLDTLTTRIAADWPSFDAQADMRTGVLPVTGPTYDRLVAWSPDYTEVIPYMATSWEQTDTSISFTLDNKATCTDGHVLTPTDVKNSFQRLVDVEKRAGSTAQSSIGGLGPGPYELEADDAAGTFTVTLGTPQRDKLTLFANMPVICPAGLEAVKADPTALETATFGSGPYELVSAVQGDTAEYRLRPEWNWGPDGATADTMAKTLVLRVIGDDTTAANLLVTGGLDIAALNGSDVERLQSDDSLTYVTQPIYTQQMVYFNMRPGEPFADAALRQAVATTVDPDAWITTALAGRGKPATSIVRSSAECYDESTADLVPTPDVDAAKQILASAGYEEQGDRLMKDGRQVRVTVLTSQLMLGGGDYLVSALNSLGIDARLRNLESAQYGTDFTAGNFDIAVQRGQNPVPYVGNNATLAFGKPTPDGTNIGASGIDNPRYDEYATAAMQSTESCDAWGQFQREMLTNHYVRPLAEWDFDIFGSSTLDFPPVTPDVLFPVYWVKAK